MPTRRPVPLWIWIAAAVGFLLSLTAAGLIAGRAWLSTDGGRNFLVSLIDGQRVGPLGVIRITGLSGDPFSEMAIADIVLVDDAGIWLRADDIELAWSPSQLLRRELAIRRAHIRHVDVFRSPSVADRPESDGGLPDFGLRLDEALIEELDVADAVFGSAGSYRVSGLGSLTRERAGRLKLDVLPLVGPGDRLSASAAWAPDAAFDARLSAEGPQGGVLAKLLLAPEDSSVTIELAASGQLPDVTGTGFLRFGERTIIALEGERGPEAAVLRARLSLAGWPLAEPIVERTGGEIDAALRTTYAEDSGEAELTLRSEAGRLVLSLPFDPQDRTLAGPVAVEASDVALSSILPDHQGRLDARGVLAVEGVAGWSFRGDASAAEFDFPSGRARAAAGPVEVRQDGQDISWTVIDARGEDVSIDALERLAPADYRVSTRGRYNLRTRIVEISQAQIDGEPGSATARGSYAVDTGALDFAGSASLAKLSRFGPLEGSARGAWKIARGRTGGPLRIGFDVTGRDVDAEMETLGELIGSRPRIVMSGVWENGRLLVESGSIDGGALAARVNGRIGEDGAVQVVASGAVRSPVSFSGGEVRSLVFEGGMSGSIERPSIRATVSDGAIELAGTLVEDISGAARLDLAERSDGEFDFSGMALGQPASVSGSLSSSGDVWRLENAALRLAGLRAEAPRITAGPDGAGGRFALSGSLAGLAGVTQGVVNGGGEFETVNDGLQGETTLQLSNLVYGDVRLRQVSLEASLQGRQARAEAHVVGLSRDDLDLRIETDATRDTGRWSGVARASGEVAGRPVSTIQPVAWRYGDEGWSLRGAVAAFGGALAADVASQFKAHTARVTVSNVELAALSRFADLNPVSGALSGSAEFSNTDAGAAGQMSVAIEGANPIGLTADPISLAGSGRLADGQLSLEATGGGRGFVLEASARAQANVGEGFAVTLARDGPLDGALRLDGRAEQIWALVGPEGQSLQGRLRAEIALDGTPRSPTLDGGFNLSEGVFDEAETGLHLEAVAADGVFTSRSARLTRLVATDGDGGGLTGSGSFNWSEGQLGGAVEFEARSLRVLRRADRSAVMSGAGAFELGAEALTLTGDFDVEQARISFEQPASASIPTLQNVRYVNFPDRLMEPGTARAERPLRLDFSVSADDRVIVFGRGLDTEWGFDFDVSGTAADPSIRGSARLVRGQLALAGRPFVFNAGTVQLNGPVRDARINIAATRDADGIEARVRLAGTPADPEFVLESTPSLPQDEILARILFGRSAAQLSALEAAQLAAALTQLAGGQAAFDPAGLLRQATGLDRINIGASGGVAVVEAGAYIGEDVYVELGAGGVGGVGAEVEWEPTEDVSIISSAQGNGDTKIRLRWKRDY
jgi:translocation and assembly module TamB